MMSTFKCHVPPRRFLRAACLRAAMELLEESGATALRGAPSRERPASPAAAPGAQALLPRRRRPSRHGAQRKRGRPALFEQLHRRAQAAARRSPWWYGAVEVDIDHFRSC